MAASMDILHDGILHAIASVDMATYHRLVVSYPRFARLITNGVRFDYAEKFGVDVHVRSECNMANCFRTQYSISWTLNGKLHRADGPAKIHSRGDVHYYINGELHRADGPAEIGNSGSVEYYIRGKRHRTDGPALIWPGKLTEYIIDGKYHRVDGPARIWSDGGAEYCINGKRHRTDGMALTWTGGKKGLYYIDDVHLSEEAFLARNKK